MTLLYECNLNILCRKLCLCIGYSASSTGYLVVERGSLQVVNHLNSQDSAQPVGETPLQKMGSWLGPLSWWSISQIYSNTNKQPKMSVSCIGQDIEKDHAPLGEYLMAKLPSMAFESFSKDSCGDSFRVIGMHQAALDLG